MHGCDARRNETTQYIRRTLLHELEPQRRDLPLAVQKAGQPLMRLVFDPADQHQRKAGSSPASVFRHPPNSANLGDNPPVALGGTGRDVGQHLASLRRYEAAVDTKELQTDCWKQPGIATLLDRLSKFWLDRQWGLGDVQDTGKGRSVLRLNIGIERGIRDRRDSGRSHLKISGPQMFRGRGPRQYGTEQHDAGTQASQKRLKRRSRPAVCPDRG